MNSALLPFAASSMLLAAAIFAPAASASADAGVPSDVLTCSLEGHLQLSPGVSITPSAGSVLSDVPATGECFGVVDGGTFSGAPASLDITGTYGDGPLSAPTGGATCSHNDGRARGVLVVNVGGRTLRVAADYNWGRAGRSGGGSGVYDGGSSTSNMNFFPDAGQNCLQVPITGLTYTIDLEVHGAMDLIDEPTAPSAELATSANLVRGTGPVRISASVEDPDGLTDVRSVALRVTDGQGRTIASWDQSAFSPTDETTARFTADVRLAGVSPWVVELVVVDGGGRSGADRETIVRS